MKYNSTNPQKYDIVIQWSTAKQIEEPTRSILFSSLDENFFPEKHRVFNGCFEKRIYYDPSSNRSDYKYNGALFQLRDYMLISHNNRETVFKVKRETKDKSEIHIKNVNKQAEIVYLSNDNRIYVHWFTFYGIYEGGLYMYTRFGSFVTNTYEGIVTTILNDIKLISLFGLLKNTEYKI